MATTRQKYLREKLTKPPGKWFIFIAWFLMIMLLFAAALAQATPAQAAPMLQETATPIPTADIDYNYQLSSGAEIEISRSINYGQIGIMAALGVVALLIFIKGLFQLFTHYLH